LNCAKAITEVSWKTVAVIIQLRSHVIAQEEGERLAHNIRAVKYMDCCCNSAQQIKEIFEEAILPQAKSTNCSIK